MFKSHRLWGFQAHRQFKVQFSTQDLFAKYTGEKENYIYYASLSGNAKSDTLSQFKARQNTHRVKETVYSADYQYSFGNQAHQLDLVAQERMGDFGLRGHQQFKYSEQTQPQSNTELMAAYHMSNDLSLIGGADIKHDFSGSSTTMLPKAGIQYKDVPIVLSYDPQTKATSVGITLKFNDSDGTVVPFSTKHIYRPSSLDYPKTHLTSQLSSATNTGPTAGGTGFFGHCLVNAIVSIH